MEVCAGPPTSWLGGDYSLGLRLLIWERANNECLLERSDEMMILSCGSENVFVEGKLGLMLKNEQLSSGPPQGWNGGTGHVLRGS